MRPEDIDKLFKERLGNTSPTPSGDLWSRLQERMEEEMPLQAQETSKKRGFIWVYSAVAASIVLLLTVGLVFFNLEHNNLPLNDQMAQQELNELPQPQEGPRFTPQDAAPAPVEQTTLAEADTEIEKDSPAQATDPAPAASTSTKALAASTPAPEKAQPVMKKAPVTSNTTASTQHLAVNHTTEKPAAAATFQVPEVEPVTPSALAVATAATEAPAAQPVEIIIKRAVSTQPAVAQAEETEPRGLEKKAQLAKNIFKQVRNLSNGDPVELADLGIRADKIALETQIGKQKISKVIHL